MTRFAPAIAAIGLATALVMSGCGGGLGTPADDPGKGTTVADKVYSVVAPVIGEQATAPNPDSDPTRRRLMDRFLAVSGDNTEWASTPLYDDRDGLTDKIYDASIFGDRSVLVFVLVPQPGPDGSSPAEEHGTNLADVELIRP
jgi:hypothetical protein